MVVVLTTLPDARRAEELVARLVQERVIACANIVPGLLSLYRWEGEVAREEEVLVLCKTVRSRVEALFGRITELHPYELPELVALSTADVSEAYCRWVRQETIEVSA